MDAVAIIKALDAVECRQFRIFSGFEVMVMYPLMLGDRRAALFQQA